MYCTGIQHHCDMMCIYDYSSTANVCRTYTLIPCSPATVVRPLANLSMVTTEGYCTTCPRACRVALVDTVLSLMRQHWSGIFSYDITPQSSLSASTLI